MLRLSLAIAALFMNLQGDPALAAAATEDFASHLGKAAEARDSGDFEAGLAAAERALALRPDDVEALRFHGTFLAFLERYDESLASLERARRLDPENLDVRLLIARVTSWSGDLPGAAEEVKEIRRRWPDSREARRLEARLAYFSGRLSEAENLLRGLVEEDPADSASRMLLDDVLRARAPARERPWRLDANYLFSTFTREDRQDWHEGFVQLSRAVGPGTTVLGRVEPHERFGVFDLHLVVGASHRATDWLSGYLEAGVTPRADFLERWAVAAGGAVRLRRDDEVLGATVATLDYRHRDFPTGGVDAVTPGIQQYLADGRLWLTVRLINTVNEDQDYTAGWLAQADWQAMDRLRLFAGLADAPETVDGETVDTRSYFAGLAVGLDETRSLRLDYLFDDREDSYIRHVIGATVTQRF